MRTVPQEDAYPEREGRIYHTDAALHVIAVEDARTGVLFVPSREDSYTPPRGYSATPEAQKKVLKGNNG